MGHATHFLQRLDRVSDGQVELALTLYRDQELLREVLSRADAPEDAERLAISLDDPREGPFIVVTREGRFVTCLGAGMLVSGLPIVTRERLDAAAARVERMREQLDRVRGLRESGADGEAALAFRRMQQQGPRFAREDAETLLRVQPIIEPECMVRFADLNVALLEIQPIVASMRLDAPQRLDKRAKELLLAFGDGAWSLAHLIVLLRAPSLRALYERVEDEDDERTAMMDTLARATFRWGTFTHMSRGLWFAAGAGKRGLASIKGSTPADMGGGAYREMALTTIALASDKLRAEAQKALSARKGPTEEELRTKDPMVTLRAMFASIGHAAIDNRETAERYHLGWGQHFMARVVARRGEVSEEEVEAIPEDVARAAFFSRELSLFGSLASLEAAHELTWGLPWLARASPAELFLPAEWARRVLPPRSVQAVARWFRPYAEHHGLLPVRRAPRRAEVSPGRNAPCPCGSGKKYKRCCARS